MSYISLTPRTSLPDRKTPEFDVWSSSTLLGRIAWFAPWRRFCFYPAPGNILFDEGCLKEIAEHVSQQDAAYKLERAKKKQGVLQ